MSELGHSARAAVAGVLLVFVVLPAAAQSGRPRPAVEPLEPRLFAYTLKHQGASEAMELVELLLSPSGTVELQPGGNTLVVRDVPVAVGRIARVLREFDRPPRELRLEIQVLRAGAGRPTASSEVPEELVGRLREVLRYDSYELLARAALSSQEGEEVTYSLGEDYDVSFRLGTMMGGQRLKLHGFRISQKSVQTTDKGRRLEPRELIHTNLNLWLDRVFTLVLAQDSASQEALMVAITCRPEEARTRR